MNWQVKFWLTLLLGALAAYTAYSAARFYRAVERDRPSAAIEAAQPTGSLADDVLVDAAGKPFSLDKLKGDVWLASFFFTACPGPCAQMNRAIASLQNEVPDDRLKFVSITVDAANDTPEVLAAYASNFAADPKRWFFLNGPLEEAQHLGTTVFKVPVGPKMHTERVILIDKASNVRGYYLTSDPSQMLALKRKLRDLLAEDAKSAAASASKEQADTSADQPASSESPTAEAPR